MPRLARDISEIARRAWFTGPCGYVLDGNERKLDLDEADLRPLDDVVGPDAANPPPQLVSLSSELYSIAYTRLRGGLMGRQSDYHERCAFIASLSAANHGHGTWEPGWIVREQDADGRWAVCKDGLVLYAEENEVRTRRGPIKAGAGVGVRMAKEIREMMPGFYMVVGDGEADDERDDELPLVRIYWSLTARGAVPYIDAITRALNPLAIPYRTKVLNEPSHYGRADAGVLYINQRYLGRAWPSIREVHAAVARYLQPRVPMFTKRIGKGLGLAEDPNNGESFGQHRCRVISEGLWEAYFRGGKTENERREALARSFQRWRISAIRPYLREARREDYNWLSEERTF